MVKFYVLLLFIFEISASHSRTGQEVAKYQTDRVQDLLVKLQETREFIDQAPISSESKEQARRNLRLRMELPRTNLPREGILHRICVEYNKRSERPISVEPYDRTSASVSNLFCLIEALQKMTESCKDESLSGVVEEVLGCEIRSNVNQIFQMTMDEISACLTWK